MSLASTNTGPSQNAERQESPREMMSWQYERSKI